MADNSNDIKYYKEELEKAIEDGVELFKHYKEISKDFQNLQKNLMNNTELKNVSPNFKKKYDEEMKIIISGRKGINNLKFVLPNHVREKQLKKVDNAERALKNEYEKELIKFKQKHNKITEFSLVDSEKIFLKEKEKIRKEKKRILSRIKIALSQLKKKVGENDYKKLIKEILGSSYELSDNKQIRFKTLMHHLESGEISNEVSKTTKKIDELMTIGNVVNRKKKMEIGIKQKEIQKLLENYEKTNKLSKESVKKDITNLVKSLNRITNAKKKEEVTTKIDRLSRSLKNEMTERERKIKYDIQIKKQKLHELEKSL